MGQTGSCPEPPPPPPPPPSPPKLCSIRNADWRGKPTDMCFQYGTTGGSFAHGSMIGAECVPKAPDCCEVAPHKFQKECKDRHASMSCSKLNMALLEHDCQTRRDGWMSSDRTRDVEVKCEDGVPVCNIPTQTPFVERCEISTLSAAKWNERFNQHIHCIDK